MDNHKVVRQFTDESFAYECAFCEAKAVFPETPFADDSLIETEPCPICRGKGVNIFKASIDDVIKCRYCDGSGKGWDENGYFVGDACRVCNGTGLIILEPVCSTDTSALEGIIWQTLHPKITEVAKGRFESGHFADSVEAALKEVNSRVKQITKDSIGEELDGSPLMQRALSLDRPILKLSDLSLESGKNIQKGYMQIFSGAMTGIRNPKAHENVIIDSKRATHLLFLASLLMSKLDEATL